MSTLPHRRLKRKLRLWEPGPQYGWKKGSCIILISSILCLSLGAAFLYFSKHFKGGKWFNGNTYLQGIIQTGLKSHFLPTLYLEEVLSLAQDSPINLDRFCLLYARETLLATGLIKHVELKRIKPHFLFIDYSLREPWFMVDNFSNLCMDKEGFFFPYLPFFSPRHLPHLFLKETLDEMSGLSLDNRSLEVINLLVETLGEETIERIDLSLLDAPSLGKQEIVVLLKNQTLLRFNPRNLKTQLHTFSLLCQKLYPTSDCLPQMPSMIDFRIKGMALLQ